MDYIYYNVNEDGQVYDCTGIYTIALDTLWNYPNDTIVVVTSGSPADREYARNMREGN